MKRLSLLIAAVLLLLAFTSCTLIFEDQLPAPDEQEHVHSFGNTFEKNADQHFRKCSCGALSEGEGHVDENANNSCDVCGAVVMTNRVVFDVTVSVVDGKDKLISTETRTVKRDDTVQLYLAFPDDHVVRISDGASLVSVVTADGISTYIIEIANVADDVDVTVKAFVCEHSWQDATCDAPKMCEKCETAEGESLGHTWVDADCTTPKTCSVCGATDGEALGHTVTDEITCTDILYCSVCGEVAVEPVGHFYDTIPEVAPTCTADGLTVGLVCSACGDVLLAQTTVPATGHTHADPVVEDGYTVVYCTDCGAEISREVNEAN